MNLQSATGGDPVSHTMLFWTGETSKITMQMQLPSLPKGHARLPAGAIFESKKPPPPPPPPPGHNVPMPSVSLQTTGGVGNAPSGILRGNADGVHTEDLGHTSIEGVLVTGKRTTTTIPLGQIGNDRPIVVHEEWRSPKLKILVKTIDTTHAPANRRWSCRGLPFPILYNPSSRRLPATKCHRTQSRHAQSPREHWQTQSSAVGYLLPLASCR